MLDIVYSLYQKASDSTPLVTLASEDKKKVCLSGTKLQNTKLSWQRGRHKARLN